MRSNRAILLIGALLLGGCTPRQPANGEFTDRDMLLVEQIESSRATNAYEAVERLRPRWMRPRGTTQLPAQPGGTQFRENQVQVYLDDQRLGGVEALRAVEIAAVQYIRHYSETEAAARWGFNHAGGAIYVSTRAPER